MVGPKKDDKVGWIKYSYEEPIHMVTEVDGARILSDSQCEFLQKVLALYLLLVACHAQAKHLSLC